MLDLPDPFGPTITDTPGENVSRVRSGKDLKPFRVIELRCMSSTVSNDSSAASAAACSASFFERPEPRAISSPSTIAMTSKVRWCGGPSSAEISYVTIVPRRARRSCRADLKSAGRRERLLDLRRERLDDRVRGLQVAELEVDRADHGLDHRREHPLGLRQLLRRRPGDRVRRGVAQPLGDPEALGDLPARAARDRLRADLRQPAGAVRVGLQARVQMRRDRERQHGVPQERQALVGIRPPLRPGRVRDRLPGEIVRQPLEQVVELAQRSGPRRDVGQDEVDRLGDRVDAARPPRRTSSRRTGPPAPAPACRGPASRRTGPRGSAWTPGSAAGSSSSSSARCSRISSRTSSRVMTRPAR